MRKAPRSKQCKQEPLWSVVGRNVRDQTDLEALLPFGTSSKRVSIYLFFLALKFGVHWLTLLALFGYCHPTPTLHCTSPVSLDMQHCTTPVI